MPVTLAPKLMFAGTADSSALRAEREAMHLLFFLFFVISLLGLFYRLGIFWMVPLHKVIEADLALLQHEVVDCN